MPTEFYLVRIARVRGRLTEARRLMEELHPLRASIGVPPRALRDSLDALGEDLWLRGRRIRALMRLDAALAAHPIALPGTVEDKADALEAAALYAAAGRPGRARAIVNAVMHATDSSARLATVAQRELASGEIALAEGRPIEALAAFRRSDLADNSWLTGYCVVCILPRLARAADRAGWTDSARIFWEGYITTPSLNREVTDPWFLAMAYRRLGELYAAAGDRDKAAEYDQRFVTLWQGADPELQSQVAAVRRRLAQLQR